MLTKGMRKLKISLMVWVIFSILTGLIYPLFVTAIARLTCAGKANGSYIKHNDQIIGSLLIGQSFKDAKYFWGRLSATPNYPYNALYSSGSNLGPTNPLLIDEIKKRIAELHKVDPTNKNPIPVDLVTSSGSGLDPEISVAAALYQVPRIARLRKISVENLQTLIQQLTKPRALGFLGENRVNVLELNLALDGLEKRDAT